MSSSSLSATHQSLFVLEFSSVALGLLAADAAAKKAQLARWFVGTVQPGSLLILGLGDVASCEESFAAARSCSEGTLTAETFLAQVHPSLVEALDAPREVQGEALGVFETSTSAGVVRLCDRIAKSCTVSLREMRFGDGLGGRGLALFQGSLGDLEAAVECCESFASDGDLAHCAILSQLSEELDRSLQIGSRLSHHLEGAVG